MAADTSQKCVISLPRSIVWSEREGEDDDSLMEMEDEQDESDRMATFEVRKSNEQEEAVNLRPGFQVCLIIMTGAVLTAAFFLGYV